jgi:hypothetical protein
MVYVCFLKYHKARITMPLSERSRCSPQEYSVRMPPDIVEAAATMVLKEIECACDFCECRIGSTPVGGHNYGNAKYVAALGVAKEP